jgi:hypothetical protein
MFTGFKNQGNVTGMVKVADNLFKVDFNLVMAESTKIGEGEENLRFFNPRHVEINQDSEIEAFSATSMDTLKSSIKSTGLVNPLVGRYKDGKISLIEGHRRWAAIGQLIEEDAHCFDVNTGISIPASALYSFVLMRVYDESTSDEECFTMSFQEDKCKEKFGPGAEIRFVYHCQMRDVPDFRILEILGNTPEWLKDTKSLIRAFEDDDQILNALFTDTINRQAAKALASVTDKNERRSIFKHALEEAKADYDVKIERMRKSVSSIDNKIENVKTKKVIAEHTKTLDSYDIYDDEIEELSVAKKEIGEKIAETTPAINVDAIKRGEDKSRKAGTSRPSSMSGRVVNSERISTKWPKFFETLKEKPQIGDTEINPQLIALCLDLLNSCTDKENNPEEFIQKWNANL